MSVCPYRLENSELFFIVFISPIVLLARCPVSEFTAINLFTSFFSILIFTIIVISIIALACTINLSQSNINIQRWKRQFLPRSFSSSWELLLVPLILLSVPKFPPEILHGSPDVFPLKKRNARFRGFARQARQLVSVTKEYLFIHYQIIHSFIRLFIYFFCMFIYLFIHLFVHFFVLIFA